MTAIYVDATTCISLGTLGELDLLATFSGTPAFLPTVVAEVTTEPARTNLDRLLDADWTARPGEFPYRRPTDQEPGTYLVRDDATEQFERAVSVLGEQQQWTENGDVSGDVEIVAEVLRARDGNQPVGVVSDDRRVRRVTEGFGATVTGTVGVVVESVADGTLDPDEGRSVVDRLDGTGLHMTGQLRDRAFELIDAASDDD